MDLKKQSGYILHSPLSFSFTMKELGGSYVQKYNTIEKEFSPDRTVTPYVLKPSLYVTDPDGIFPDGDYTGKLVSAKWTVDKYVNHVKTEALPGAPVSGKPEINYGDYVINTENHALTYMANTGMDDIVIITFSADYIDTRRRERQVQHFEWSKTLSCVIENPQNVYVRVDSPSKVNLSPFKHRFRINIMATAYNGIKALPNELCSFTWQYLDNSRVWRDISADCPWHANGASTRGIGLLQDFIGRLTIRCKVTVKDMQGVFYSKSILLRRWYGQYEESLEFTTGKYISCQMKKAEVNVSVTNRQGVIADPCRYFDISIYYPDVYGTMRCISHNTTASVDKNEFIEDSHSFGYAVRELTEYFPLMDQNGGELCDAEGNLIYIQAPTVNIEV